MFKKLLVLAMFISLGLGITGIESSAMDYMKKESSARQEAMDAEKAKIADHAFMLYEGGTALWKIPGDDYVPESGRIDYFAFDQNAVDPGELNAKDDRAWELYMTSTDLWCVDMGVC